MATISNEVKGRALTWITDVNSELDNLSNRLRPKWYDWWNLYRSFENQQKLPGQSNIFIPKVYEVIEKKVPGVIAHEPRFIVSPRVNDANAYVGALRDTLGFWWDQDKMQSKLERWVKDAFIFGVGYAKVDWHQETKMVKSVEIELDEETGEAIEREIEEEQIVNERPTSDLVSIFDIKVDPRVECFQDGVGVIHVINDVRWAELMSLGDMYDLSELKGMDPEQLSDSGYTSAEEEEQDEDKGISMGAENIDRNRITLMDFWGLFSRSGKPEDERESIVTAVVVDGEPTYIIRVEENDLGFRPFVKVDDRVIRGEFYSVGEVEPLEGLQIEYNNLRNARIDFNNAINYPEWIYNINANINPANLVHRPNNIIPVDVPLGSDVRSSLRPVDKPVQPVSGYNEESQLNRDMQTVSQTIDFTDRGGSQGFTNTATGIKSRDIQVGMQASNIVRHLENAISEMGRMWLGLANKFVEDEITIRRSRTEQDVEMQEIPTSEVPDKFTKIDRAALESAVENFEVKVEAGSTTADTAEGKASDAVNIANTAVQFAGMGVPVDLVRVFKDILRDSFQKTNAEEYISQQQPQQQLPPGEAPGPQTNANVPIQPSQPTQV